jgi:hypothetical protein
VIVESIDRSIGQVLKDVKEGTLDLKDLEKTLKSLNSEIAAIDN